MKTDLPLCDRKICRYNSDGNCSDKSRYDSCEYTIAKKWAKGK